jgi:DNA-binding beta-propeller fold protein YncE
VRGHRRVPAPRLLLAPLVAGILLAAFPVAAGASIQFDGQWGSASNPLLPADGTFSSPSRAATDSSSNVYVTDSGNSRIQKFNSTGTFLSKFGTLGTGNGQFLAGSALGIAIDSGGNAYVVDKLSNRVQKFNSAGTFVTAWGGLGTGNGQLNAPTGIAIDPSSGNVYVADTGNNRIQKFTSSGAYVTQWGSAGVGDGNFASPSGVAVDSTGDVYVADSGNSRIQRFTSTGGFVTKWGSVGMGDGQFGATTTTTLDLAIGSSDNVIVVDPTNNRVQKFRPIGTFITKWGTAGSGTSQFTLPSGVAVSSADEVYVVDSGNSRVERFHETDTSAPDTTIDTGPTALSGASTSFTFTSTDTPLLGFECRLDSAQWVSCTSPKSYSGLSDGSHTFQVRAVDAAGNPDPTPASSTWTVDGTPPDTTIGSGPSGQTNDPNPTFGFSSSESGSSFQCRFDSDAFASCSGPGDTHTPASDLSDGFHTFEVRAKDQAGNTDPSPASQGFTVDTQAPNTTIGSGPSGQTNDPTPTFGFSSSETGSSFECKVDAASYASCSSPRTTSHLVDGSHTFYARAVDTAGNPDPTPASRSFTVQTAAVHVSGSTLYVTAATGAKDNLSITRPSGSVVRVHDVPSGPYTGSGLHAFGGCTRVGDYKADCNAAGISLIQVNARDQTDKVVNGTAIASLLYGRSASDTLVGGSKADSLTGGAGADVMKGKNGSDQLFARDLTNDMTIDCDGGNTPGASDEAELDLLPKDSMVTGCETVTRG